MDAIRRFRLVIFRSICALFLVMLVPVAASTQVPENSVALSGAALSSSLFDALEDAGLAPEKQYLSELHRDDFPYNVIVTLGENIYASSFTPSRLTTLVFVISQTDYASRFDLWLKFLDGLQSYTLPVTTKFVFTANDTSLLPKQEQVGMPAGTLRYIESIENPEKLCVLVLSPANYGPFVIPGAASSVASPKTINAPGWLTSQLPFPIFGTLLSLYRLNLTSPDDRLSALGEHEIVSTLLIWNPGNETETAAVLAGLRQFITGFTFGAQNDLNYSVVPTALENIVISEFAFTVLYVVIAALCLFYLCVFFVHTKKLQILLLPLFLAATMLLFMYTDFAGIILRVLIVFIVFSLLNTLLNTFLHIHHATYGALYVLQTALNVLVFGTVDAELLLLFTVEFIIAIAFLPAMRQIAFCGIAALLSAVCYIFILLNILVYADYGQIHLSLHSGFFSNAVLACISLPFLLLWARSQTQILTFFKEKNLKVFRSERKLTRHLVLGIALTVTAAVVVLVVSLPLARNVIFRRPLPDAPNNRIVNDNTGDNISVESRVDVYFDQEIVTVTAKAELPIIRCNISVQPLIGNAAIYSEEPVAIVSQNGAVEFRLNEYPPNPLTVTYIAERNLPSRVLAEFFLAGDSGTIIRSSSEIEIH